MLRTKYWLIKHHEKKRSVALTPCRIFHVRDAFTTWFNNNGTSTNLVVGISLSDIHTLTCSLQNYYTSCTITAIANYYKEKKNEKDKKNYYLTNYHLNYYYHLTYYLHTMKTGRLLHGKRKWKIELIEQRKKYSCDYSMCQARQGELLCNDFYR